MKKIIKISFSFVLALLTLCGCMGGTDTDSSTSKNKVSSNLSSPERDDTAANALGDYTLDIKSCRLAKDYEGKDIVIVTYGFANESEESTSFTVAINDKAFQNGVGLNKCYVAAENANYADENQTKDVKKGARLDVEVAYYLNDTKTDIEVECSELISLDDKKITKIFSLE